METSAFSMLLRNKTTRAIGLSIPQEELNLAPGASVSLLCFPNDHNWPIIEIEEKTIVVHAPGGSKVTVATTETSIQPCLGKSSKERKEAHHLRPCFVLRNMVADGFHVFEEPCTFECWMPKGSDLLFEEYCDPATSPLVIEVQPDLLRIDSWLPPDDEISKALAWNPA
jgi:hypothetical protein